MTLWTSSVVLVSTVPLKKRYLWVSEDLLHLRWCHGKVKDWHDSDDNLTFCEVANIGNIKVMDNATLALYLIDDPDHDLCFQVGKDKAQRWKDCLTRLCQDQSRRLAFRQPHGP